MTQDVSRFRAREELLNRGKMTPVLAHALSFVGLPEAEELPKINKAFRRATQELQGNVCSQLGLTQNAIVIAAGERDVSCEAELEQVWRELNDAATRVGVQLRAKEAVWGGRQRMEFESYLQRLADLKSSAEQDAPDRRQVRMQSLLAQLKPLREQIDATNRYLEHYNRGVRGAEDPIPHLFGMLQQSIARENVAERFRNVITEKGLDSQNGRACLAALSEKQRAAASFTRIHSRQFVEAARRPAFSVERFIEGERVAIAAEIAGEEDHLLFWEAIMEVFRQLNVQVLDQEMPHTSPEILRWLDNPANQERLDRVERLRINGLRHLPSRIEKLRNLRDLDCFGFRERGQLSNLPPELENLVHLQRLGLDGNLLEEVPEAIRHCPELQRLSLARNRIQEIPLFLIELRDHLEEIHLDGNPIRVLPEDIYREFGANADLDAGHLEEMPFSFWFRDIPYRVEYVWAVFMHGIFSEIDNRFGIFSVPLQSIIAITVVVPLLSFFGLLLLFTWIFEPLFSLIREEFGCDPMVRAEPQERNPRYIGF